MRRSGRFGDGRGLERIFNKSSGLLDEARPDASSADLHANDPTILNDPNPLYIWPPDSFSLPVGMAHVVPKLEPLVANLTPP
jgi:hypothetical protein